MRPLPVLPRWPHARLVLRRVEVKDLKGCAELEAASYPADEAASPEGLAMRQKVAGDFFWATFEGDALAGFVCGTCADGSTLTHESMEKHIPGGRLLCIHSVVVQEKFRRRGLALAMLREYVKAVAAVPGAPTASALIAKAGLVSLYVKAGFEFLGPSAVVHGKEPWFELQVRDLQRAAQAEPLVQCDAFADCPGAGNQAAVVFSQRNGDETWMQKVAAENNLSETAFVELLSPGEADGPCRFSLRWFTPTTEVDLCGHATLATAHALWSTNRAAKKRRIDFETKASGVLTCKLCDGWIEMDFPEDPPAMGPAAAKTSAAVLAKALGAQEADVLALGRGKFDVLCELRPEAFEALKPNQALLAEVECRGVAVTTASGKDAERAGGPGDGKKLSIDFRSRFFAPRAGLPEDPVTGSAHCMLAPYWAKRLGRADGEVVGFQASARGGVVKCRLAAGRVALAGPATTTLEGMLYCG